MNRILPLAFSLTTLACIAPAYAEPPVCGADIDACARTLVLENAGYIKACAAAYPAAKPLYERAFKHWSVMKMPIPGLAEVAREDSTASINAAFEASEDLRNLSEEERNHECSSRLANLTTPTPTLAGHAFSLPPNALNKYSQ
ncbi:MAG: hypothetical protein IT492_17090 [Gammaproteobacteria bacterium]|nr:hypothetical protein [Gammaproteobacteria bacterium]